MPKRRQRTFQAGLRVDLKIPKQPESSRNDREADSHHLTAPIKLQPTRSMAEPASYARGFAGIDEWSPGKEEKRRLTTVILYVTVDANGPR